ncbi:MAG: dienelactone hydrolase family protein [Acidobacteriota bacterium]
MIQPIAHRLSIRLLLLLALAVLLAACGPPEPPGTDEYVERMAEEHADDKPVVGALPSDTSQASLAVTEASVTFPSADGTPVAAFLAQPENPAVPAPGVIVIHEWWGLNDNIRDMARALAKQGYAALAVDLYAGQVADAPDAARALMQGAMEQAETLRAHLRGANTYLRDTLGAPTVGSIGWCFGGAWSLDTAIALGGDLDAAVIYYGRVETDEARLATIEAPILGHFGSVDQGIPLEQVRAFEAAMNKLGKNAAVRIYEGANHAFANPSGTMHDPAAAEQAWQLTTTFFADHLLTSASDQAPSTDPSGGT